MLHMILSLHKKPKKKEKSNLYLTQSMYWKKFRLFFLLNVEGKDKKVNGKKVFKKKVEPEQQID